MARFILLTGKPGIGKSTAMLRIAAGRPNLRGFVTSEIRVEGRRQGFAIETLSGRRGILASPSIASDIRFGTLNDEGNPRLGVDLDFLDRVANQELDPPEPFDGAIIVDEIGPMQASSESFRERIEQLADRDILVIGTVAAVDDPWIAGILDRHGVAVIALTKQNRDAISELLISFLAMEHDA